MCSIHRRRFFGQLSGILLTPLAASLSACGKGHWPEGMSAIEWGRDTCARCRMVIADRRFAAEVRGGPDDRVFKFDDIGCVVFWLKNQPWGADARIWVAEGIDSSDSPAWLDARRARYLNGHKSPMRYGFAATATPQAGDVAFTAMSEQILLKGR